MHLPKFRLRADNAADCQDELDERPERGGQARGCPKCGGIRQMASVSIMWL